MILPLKRYAQFDGRSTRREFWLFRIVCYAVPIAMALLAEAAPDWVEGILALAFMGLLLPMISVSVRRLHDQDKSGWWYFACYIPLVGWLVWLILMLTPGSQGENDYGFDPREPSMDHLQAVFE